MGNPPIDTSGADLLLALVYGDTTSLITDLVPGGVAASALVLSELAKAGRLKQVVFDGFEDGDKSISFITVENPSATMDRTANRVLSNLDQMGYTISEALVASTVPIFSSSAIVEEPTVRVRSGIADVIMGKRAGSYAELSVISVLNSVHNSKDLLGIISGLVYSDEIGVKLYSRPHVWSGLDHETTMTINNILAELFDVTFEGSH